MSTRHYQLVIDKEGVKRIKQYGQFDGYPSCQGVGILRHLRAIDLAVYQLELSKIEQITDSQLKEVESSGNPEAKYPYLYRGCGCDIHILIAQGRVKFVAHCSEEEAAHWCQGFYTVDFQKGEFISYYGGVGRTYKLDNLPSDELYLSEMQEDEDEE